MADPRNQYSAHHTDEYGNPIGHGAGTFGNHPAGTNVGATGLHPGVTDVGVHSGYAGTATLQRSGSSSSSSSEDDGQGGRRKKGLKDKIKEKLPGGAGAHKEPLEQGTFTEQGHGYNTTGTTGAYKTEPEKKGMVEKIKEKLPGHN